MLFWLVIAAVTGLVALALGLAFRRGAAAPGAELALYRDQLKEVERDLSRGLLTGEEAERARLEVSRRLLEADRAARAAPGLAAGPGRGAAVVTGVLVAAVALLGYALLGAPGYRDLPQQVRIRMAEDARADRPSQQQAEAALPPRPAPQADAEFLDLMTRLRQAVAQRPGDEEGLRLLVRNEAALGDYIAAWQAQRKLIEVKGGRTTSGDEAQLAALMIAAAGGYVSPEAEGALTRALKLSPTNPLARYYSGLLFAQTGRPDMAFRLWQPLLAEGPPDAPWVQAIRADIEGVAQLAGVRFTLPPETGPTAEDVEAASDISDADRAAMIEGMVAGLADRLQREGGPPEDYARLITSLAVLDRRGQAAEILADARARFATDAEALKVLQAAADAAGLDR